MAKRERYPLQVEVLQDCCMSKGHHDPVAFLEAAGRAMWHDPEWFGLQEVAYVRHEWWRHAVRPKDADDTIYYNRASGPGPGAFPVTIIT